MTEPVYCKDCEFFDHDEVLSAKYLEYLAYCEKSGVRICPYDEPCEDFKPREGEGE